MRNELFMNTVLFYNLCGFIHNNYSTVELLISVILVYYRLLRQTSIKLI